MAGCGRVTDRIPTALTCPICGRALRVTAHAKYDRWTKAQLRLVERLRGLGFTKKIVAKVLQADVTAGAIDEIEARHGWRERRSA